MRSIFKRIRCSAVGSREDVASSRIRIRGAAVESGPVRGAGVHRPTAANRQVRSVRSAPGKAFEEGGKFHQIDDFA